MNKGTSAPFAKLGGDSMKNLAKTFQESIEEQKDGLKEVDIINLSESIRIPFRNHDLLNAVMLREEAPILRVLISPDLERFYYLRSTAVVIRRLGDIHSPLANIEEEDTEYQSIAVSPNNRFLVVAVKTKKGNEVRLHAVGNNSIIKTISDFDAEGDVRYLSVSADSKYIACAHSDSNVYVFGVDDESKVTLGGHGGAVTVVKHLTECNNLLSGDSEGTVRHWHVELKGEIKSFDVDDGERITGLGITKNDEEFVASTTSGTTSYFSMSGRRIYSFSEG